MGISNADQLCMLCGRVNPTLRHVLTGCPVALNQGRYIWRHDSVLKRIILFLEELLEKYNQGKLYLPPPSKTFLKPGEEKATARQPRDSGELALAKDWVMLDDLGEKHLIMPTEVTHVATSLRSDIFLYSLSAKRAVILELTCPNEDGFEISKKLKEDRYINLQKQIIANGFDCNIYTIEVGVRGNIDLDQLTFGNTT